MSSIASHYIFSNDLQIKLSNSSYEINNTIKEAYGSYIVGAQGPDIFFYDLMHLTITSKKNNIGSRMHTLATDIFFANYVREILKQKAWNRPPVIAYLFGMLAHYSLDCCVHPYVYSRTTLAEKTKQAAKESLAAHCQMESDIDELLYYERYHKTINLADRTEFMSISSEEIKTIAPVLAATINHTYGCSLTTSYIIGTFNRAKLTDRILQDSTGLKKKIVSPIEKKLLGSSVGTSLIFHTELPDRSCLNEDHQMWKIPGTDKTSTESFYELYNKAIDMAYRLINSCSTCILDTSELYAVTQSVNADIDILTLKNNASGQLINNLIHDFGRATGGLSYHSGINWRRKSD